MPTKSDRESASQFNLILRNPALRLSTRLEFLRVYQSSGSNWFSINRWRSADILGCAMTELRRAERYLKDLNHFRIEINHRCSRVYEDNETPDEFSLRIIRCHRLEVTGRLAWYLAEVLKESGTGFCSISNLAEEINAHPTTVKRAVAELEDAGLIIRIAGCGRGNLTEFVLAASNGVVA